MPDIALWHRCNNNCVMCTNPDEFFEAAGKSYTLARQREKLERYLSGEFDVYFKNTRLDDYFLLTGGEPTLHPHALELMSFFRRRAGARELRVLSNGRRFCYRDFTAEFLRRAGAPLLTAVALHAATARAHDAVTRVRGSFAQTVEGLRNLLALRGRGQEVEVRVILHAKTLAGLPALLRFLRRGFGSPSAYRLTLIYFEVEGQSEKNLRSLFVPLSRVAGVLAKNRGLLAAFPRLELYHFPLCVLTPELRPRARVTLPRSDRVYPPVCRRCAAKSRCLGLMKWYRAKHGDGELSALKGGEG